MGHDVFVSYSSKDKPVADAAVAALEARGIRAWIAPRDIVPGVDWSEAIIEAINACKVMLLVFSRNANESHQIKREVERAVAKGVPVIPLRIEDVPLAKSLEYFISMPHWIDALTPERQQRLDYLAETVALLLERQSGRAADARPASPPPPHVTPARAPQPAGGRASRVPIAIGVAALVGVAAWLVLRRPGPVRPLPQPQSEPRPEREAEKAPAAPTPAAPRASIDPRLVGDWTATVTAQGVTTQQRMSIAPDGRTRYEAVLSDSGTMQAGNGGILQTSRDHGTFGQAYAFEAPGLVTITGPLGSADWRRVRGGGGGSATFDAQLSGTWESETRDPKGQPWMSTLEMSPSGAYTFRSVLVDEGVMTTEGDRFSVGARRHDPKPAMGTLTWQGSDTVVMRDEASGDAATWTRSR